MTAIEDTKKAKRGRPKTDATPVLVRLAPQQLAALDAWIATFNDPPSRPAAVRTLIELGLKSHAPFQER